MNFKPVNLPASELAFQNKVFVSPGDYKTLQSQYRKSPVYIELNGYVFTVVSHDSLKEGLGLSKLQREMLRVSMIDVLDVKLFNIPDDFYLGSLSLQVENLSKKRKLEVTEDELELKIREYLDGLVVNTNQVFLIEFQALPLQVKVVKQTLIDLRHPDPKEESKACSKGLIHKHL